MIKLPISYIKEDPFKIIEEGYHLSRNQVSESLFSLGNEYHGIRGFNDENSLIGLQGSYFNGIYEYALQDSKEGYKGIIKRTHFMINSVNWVKCKIVIDDETLDLSKVNFDNFYRELDFKTGVYLRKFDWHLQNGIKVEICFKRMLHMEKCMRAYQIIELKANDNCNAYIELSLDSNVKHWNSDCYYQRENEKEENNIYELYVKTLTTNQSVLSLMKIQSNAFVLNSEIKDKEIICKMNLKLKRNVHEKITRFVVNFANKEGYLYEQMKQIAYEELNNSYQEGFEQALKENTLYWNNIFEKSDIVIDGDSKNQQGIRFTIFQLQQTYHGFSPKNNIGAKGLTGEAYSGHAFWDTETYCLPYYLLNNPIAAKDLLLFRYYTLPEAKERAEMLDCKGACYPIATLNGKEGCNLWQHASLQFQPSTAVAYGIKHYVNVTNDINFLLNYGLEMLIEISKFLLSRGDYNQTKEYFGFYGVMGPDEFQMMVNHNTYTNYMAKKTFEYTLEVIEKYKGNKIEKVLNKCHFDEQLKKEIQEAALKMKILYDKKTLLFEQHDGYYDLPHVDIKKIPESDFPLYTHWSYDRIYRNDMIKQPDVLMLMFLYNKDFTYQQKVANYEFYEPRCIHESSLSPSVHSILASEINKTEDAISFFEYATRMDLDDYNKNTCEGLHTTSIAAAWMNIVYGFGGVRTDDEILVLKPTIPTYWNHYSFNLTFRNVHLKIQVYKELIFIEASSPITLKIYDKFVNIEKFYEGKMLKCLN